MSTEPLLLAIDDEPGILGLMKLELSAQGFHVIVCSNGEEALRIVEERRPDVVLLDLMMPELKGLELMRRIRERANTPIILVTAMGREADKVRGLESGADDYIVKPFSLAELGARIRALVRRSAGHWGEHVVRVGDVEIDLDGRFV